MDLITLGFTGLLGLLALTIVFLVGYGITWLLFGRKEYSAEKTVTAKVLATSFHPEKTHTNFGPVVGGNGGIAITTSTEDEEDIVLLRSMETGRLTIDSADLLDVVTQGEEVQLTYQEKYTYWAWDPSKKTLDSYVPVKVVTSKGEEVAV